MFCMKKGGVILFVFLIFFVSLVVAESSENEMQIRILGCSDGVNFASPGQCVGSTGWCSDFNVILDSFDVPNACSRGVSPSEVVGGTPKPYQVCCPTKTHECISNNTDGVTSGTAMVNNVGDAFFCVPATKDCSEYPDKETCIEDHYGQCAWNGTACIPRSNSCYEYTDENSCNEDELNVSRFDPNCRYGETESSGIPYIISQESCKCFWNSTTSSCGLRYNITPSFGDGMSYSLCEYVFELTEGCSDGFETYTYKANYGGGTYGASNPVAAGDARCTDRTGRRRCGVPIVKVPFFSFFNVMMVLFLLSIFYVIKIKFFGGRE